MTCIPLGIMPDTNPMFCRNRRPDKVKRVRQMGPGKSAGHTSFSPAYNLAKETEKMLKGLAQ